MATSISSRFQKTGDFYLLVDTDLRGGFRVVTSIEERDAIPIQARKSGMLVRVVEADKISTYELGFGLPITNAGWIEAELGGGGDFIPTAGGNLEGELKITEFGSMNFNDALLAEVLDGNLVFTSTVSQDEDDPEPQGMVAFNDGIANTIEINPKLGQIVCTREVALSSDRNKKTDIRRITESLKIVRRMHGYRYKRIGETIDQVGLMAQEVKQVLPEAVGNMSDGSLAVFYGNLAALFVENINDLVDITKEQDARLLAIEKHVGIVQEEGDTSNSVNEG